MSLLPQSMQKLPLARLAIVVFLLLLVIGGAAPAYLGGKWPWQRSPQVTALKQLRDLRRQALEVPGWQVTNHQVVTMNNQKWILQEMIPSHGTEASPSKQTETEPEKVALLLLPQNSSTHQPQVEWTDLKGAQRWKTDSLQQSSVQFGNQPSTKADFQYLRAWNEQQTYAVSQWYAWPTGGSASPGQWFWADQLAQLQGTRLPWVAVSILIPIEPLGNIDQSRPKAQALIQAVQTALMSGPLK